MRSRKISSRHETSLYHHCTISALYDRSFAASVSVGEPSVYQQGRSSVATGKQWRMDRMMYVRAYECMYVHVYVRTQRTYVCMYICTHVRLYGCIQACMGVPEHVGDHRQDDAAERENGVHANGHRASHGGRQEFHGEDVTDGACARAVQWRCAGRTARRRRAQYGVILEYRSRRASRPGSCGRARRR